MPNALTGHAAAIFRVDPAQLSWMTEFGRLLDMELEATSGALLKEADTTVRRMMHERFQQMHTPRHGGLNAPHLEESIHGMAAPLLAGVVLEVGRGVPYALQRELGGPIFARSKPYLVYQTYDGIWHRARMVNQVGTHFFGATIRRMWIVSRQEYAAATRRALALALRTAPTVPHE